MREIESPRAPNLPDLEPLVRSIARLGVLQPLVVRARNGRSELIAGGRRRRAAALAELTEVPCLVHVCDEEPARALKEAAALGRAEPPRRAPAAICRPSRSESCDGASGRAERLEPW